MYGKDQISYFVKFCMDNQDGRSFPDIGYTVKKIFKKYWRVAEKWAFLDIDGVIKLKNSRTPQPSISKSKKKVTCLK